VSLRTYKRFERNGNGSIETLVKVVYALGRAAAIDLLFQAELQLETMEQKLARIRKLADERKAVPGAADSVRTGVQHPVPPDSTRK
jgi:hypothetical protein